MRAVVKPGMAHHGAGKFGAGDGNRTHVSSLGSCSSTIELHPRVAPILATLFYLSNGRHARRECAKIAPSRLPMCADMQILVNGNPTDIAETLTAQDLIQRLELTGKRIALEVNGEIVPRSTHGGYHFKNGDKIEVVHAIGGG